jgi:hypothetical protein
MTRVSHGVRRWVRLHCVRNVETTGAPAKDANDKVLGDTSVKKGRARVEGDGEKRDRLDDGQRKRDEKQKKESEEEEQGRDEGCNHVVQKSWGNVLDGGQSIL